MVRVSDHLGPNPPGKMVIINFRVISIAHIQLVKGTTTGPLARFVHSTACNEHGSTDKRYPSAINRYLLKQQFHSLCACWPIYVLFILATSHEGFCISN